MKKSLNCSYRLIWSQIQRAFIVVSELSRTRGNKSGQVLTLAIVLVNLLTPSSVLAAYTNIVNGPTSDETVDGQQDINTGGSTTNTTIINNGTQNINGGVANNTTINDGDQIVNTGAAYNTIINSSSSQYVSSLADGVIVNSGGSQYTLNGETRNITVYSGGVQYMQALHAADAPTVNFVTIDGGRQVISFNRPNIRNQLIVNDSIVKNNGVQDIYTMGVVNRTELSTGGTQNINRKGVANDTVINDGGLQVVMSGGTANRSVVNTGGNMSVKNLGISNSTIVNNNGTQTIESGGIARTTTVNNNGNQSVLSGGTATDTELNSGGKLSVSDGGTATGIKQNSGGAIIATTDSAINGNNANGAFDVTSKTATNLLLENGGTFAVNSGGQANKTLIGNGGNQNINTGGMSTSTTVNAGGTETINSGGQAVSTTVNDKGTQSVLSGGTATNTELNSGGKLSVSDGGTVTGIKQNSGGAIIATTDSAINGNNANGAFSIDIATHIADNLLLENGGILYVLDDGKATNTVVNSGGILDVAEGGALFGKNILNDGATLRSRNVINDGDLHLNTSGDSSFSGNLDGSGRLFKEGSGVFTLSGTLNQAGGTFLQSGTLVMDALNAATNITAQRGTLIHLTNYSSLTGNIDPADMIIDKDSVWTMTGDSTLENLTLSGDIDYQAPSGGYVAKTLKVSNLTGNNGIIILNSDLQGNQGITDKLVIDGGKATGSTELAIRNAGGIGAPTTGEGIQLVSAINGATTENNAFTMGKPVQSGAYNYSLFKGVNNENWYLSSKEPEATSSRENYRSAAFLYNSLFAQAMDYDAAVLGSLDSRRYSIHSGSSAAEADNGAFWGRFQAGQLQHRNGSKTLGDGNTPDSKGGYTFVQLGGDLIEKDSNDHSMHWVAGVYGATGISAIDVQRNGGSKAGTVRDTVYSIGGYLTGVHQSGFWVDTILQGSRHNMESQPVDNNNLTTRGWGYIGSIEGGKSFAITDGIILEPQLQYQYRGLNLNNGNDGDANVDFSSSGSQQIRTSVKIGNTSDKLLKIGDKAPVSLWVRPSVIQTFGTTGKVNMSVSDLDGSSVVFKPDQDGTSIALDTGLDAQIRKNATFGVRAGYTIPIKDGAAGGYGGQLNLKISF